MTKRKCFSCNSTNTYVDKKGYGHWYSHEEQWFCENCNNVLYKNPRWHPITNPIRAKSRRTKGGIRN